MFLTFTHKFEILGPHVGGSGNYSTSQRATASVNDRVKKKKKEGQSARWQEDNKELVYKWTKVSLKTL